MGETVNLLTLYAFGAIQPQGISDHYFLNPIIPNPLAQHFQVVLFRFAGKRREPLSSHAQFIADGRTNSSFAVV